MKKIFLASIILFFATRVSAQDKIYKLKGNVIEAKVIEIGTDEIKYRLINSSDGPVYVVEKSLLNRIEFADGRIEKYQVSYKDPENYDGQLIKGIKLNFLAPLLGYSQFTYEKSLSPLKSYELSLGIIGAGKNQNLMEYYVNGQYTTYKRSALGLFVEGGYKFKKIPTFFSKGTRMSHIMQGNYFEPKITLGYFTDHALNYKNNEPQLEKRSNVFGAFTLNLGKQWVFGDKVLLDIYWGLGYAFDNHGKEEEDFYLDYNSNNFAIQKLGSGTNVGVNGGIRIGLLIK